MWIRSFLKRVCWRIINCIKERIVKLLLTTCPKVSKRGLVYGNFFKRDLSFFFQIALATFLLNVTVLILTRSDEIGVSILADVLPDILTNLTDAEAQFRAYVALGTLISSNNAQQNALIKLKVKENKKFVEQLNLNTLTHQGDVELKRKNCALQLQRTLN